MSLGQKEDILPVLLQLTEERGQRSFRVISDTFKNRVKWTNSGISRYISASGGTTRCIIVNLIEHLMKSASVVVMTQRSKFIGQRSNFQYGPMEMKFNMEDLQSILNIIRIL